MNAQKVYTAVGLMSGTSADGVDAALIETDGYSHVRALNFLSLPYTPAQSAAIRAAFGLIDRTDSRVKAAKDVITQTHIQAVERLLQGRAADLIGFHGQTIFHDPAQGMSVQIGDAGALARAAGIPVVYDFRSADVAAGGQGAPFLPLYHQALARAGNIALPAVILNIGGVSNVTWIGLGQDDILAFDCGPGNALIDDFVRTRTGQAFDADGALGRLGTIHADLVAAWMQQSAAFFTAKPPKSLDRNHWQTPGLEVLSDEDGAATLTAFTTDSIAVGAQHFPQTVGAWFVTGGGRRNNFLMDLLRQRLHASVQPVEALGWNGDALEAQGFAYLAVRSVLGLPLSLTTTTGVPAPQTGGRIARP
ncbi:MAG: anhydro-N-acetylmuramic acid kinase [Alphaproteobacteria bacterium]|nr:anhydro-N-acetylmuramic acid kinase [Alphaproteobacteria bacterium]